MNIVVLLENEHLSFLHKKVVSEQNKGVIYEIFVVMEQYF